MEEQSSTVKTGKLVKTTLIFLAVLLVAVVAQIIRINMSEKKEMLSFYSEWNSNGVPVDVCVMKPSEYKVWNRVTATKVPGGEMRSYVPRQMWESISVGQNAEVKINGYQCAARISFISQVRDIDTGLYEVRLTVLDPSLLPDSSFYHARVNTHTYSGVITLPVDAISYEGDLKSAWIAEEGLARKIVLDDVYSDGLFVVLDKTDLAGKLFVIRGEENLEEGQKVFIHKNMSDCPNAE
ncbi:MAG TPA: hypothetical protein PLT05_00895 [bacterium]|nr:hypothetical protein [Myxococcales bacterium]HQG12910.1 hypothetical protein [bacterium]HQH80071.1 hypothetical protein [bacterium]